jgi:two-component system chemotaxis response regulator CheB
MTALRTLLRQRPQSFPLPVAVVVHRHRDSDDTLVPLLQRELALPVREVLDKDPIQAGHVQVGPCDYHLLVEPMYFSLSTDDPVQYARPSIDVFLESAADVLGERAIAVILTGANRDGARGAAEIHRRGGIVIVQDPLTAESSVMPAAALEAVPGALVRRAEDIGTLLIKLAAKISPTP